MALEEELLGVTQEPKAGRSGDHSAPEDALGDKDPTRVPAEVGGAEPVARPFWTHLRVIGLSEGVASAEWRRGSFTGLRAPSGQGLSEENEGPVREGAHP